jgi:hypothetical protein
MKGAYRVVKGLQILLHPIDYRRRRRGAEAIIAQSEWAIYIDGEKGYARFGSETFRGLRACFGHL